MRIILTGSTGLIGGAIWERLRASHQVVRFGRRPVCELCADFSFPDSVKKVSLSGYDALIHCAGIVDTDFIKNPQSAWAQAVRGIDALAAQAIAGGVKRLIYFSTTHVYGDFDGVLTEESQPNPMTQYAIAHYAGEQILKSYSRKGLEISILRPNAVYGIPSDWDTFNRWSLVPFDLPLQAVYHGKIVLKSSGIQKRNFVSTKDLAFYVEKLLLLPRGKSPLFLNSIGKDTMSIYDFAKLCAKIYFDKKKTICLIKRPEPSLAAGDFEILTNRNDFQPQENVSDFLNEFIDEVIKRLTKGKVYGQN
ncbi:MAG: NAD(P)-dependent oxidoreductase [Candidatus Omnitrophota bacterium]